MIKETFGSTIARLRKERGMTQFQLAELMGVTDKAVSKWERDISMPDTATLPKLADLFGLTVDELIQTGSRDIPRDWLQVKTICSAVALAMGIAVIAMRALDVIQTDEAMNLIAIGLVAAGISLLNCRQ